MFIHLLEWTAVFLTVSLSSSYLDIVRTIRTQSTSHGQNPNIFAGMLLSQTLWGWYAVLTVDHALFVICTYSFSIAVLGSSHFVYYAPTPTDRRQCLQLYCLVLISTVLYCFLAWLLLNGKDNLFIVGLTACSASVFLYASPLTKIRDILRTGDITSLSPYVLAMAFCCSGAWSFYGLLVGDGFMIVGNTLGFILQIVQCVIFFKFRNTTKSPVAQRGKAEKVMTVSTADSLEVSYEPSSPDLLLQQEKPSPKDLSEQEGVSYPIIEPSAEGVLQQDQGMRHRTVQVGGSSNLGGGSFPAIGGSSNIGGGSLSVGTSLPIGKIVGGCSPGLSSAVMTIENPQLTTTVTRHRNQTVAIVT